ncbi:S8 family serine peptidase [Bacillus sp. sid0103]|uniref:S8 family serine peptidase n=1 Tax=Bacillus sp. sid0103 TaxID=2856337 RepID=UPI001C487B63|nr:S8 family serine peptidase [Bacillus sp. sid0103]MBV7507946.1 S8 family serine peptidase [Bacillus sp. sid0103]
MKKKTLLTLPVTAFLLASTIFTGTGQAAAQTGPTKVVTGENQVNSSKNLRKSQMKEVITVNKKVSINKKTQNNLVTEVKEKLKNGDSQSKNKYEPGELIIKYKKKVTTGEISTLQKKFSLKSTKKLKSFNAEVVKIPAGVSSSDYINTLKKDSTIESVQPNYKYYATDTNSSPNYYDQLWGLDNSGQPIKEINGLKDIDVDAPEGWKKFSSTLPEVVVGVIDTGVDINHPDLAGKIWTNTKELNGEPNVDDDHNGYIDDVNGWDFYNDDNTVYDSLEGDEHGTHVSGTIAAALEGNDSSENKGVIGVAPNVKILPIKFLGPDGGTTSDAIEAIAYAKTMGVKITNNSWGGGEYDPLLQEAIENSNSLFVAAAGNDGMDNDEGGAYPASFESANILAVAAVDNKGKLAPFSNYGYNSVDVAAPGVDILSTVPKFPLDELTKALNIDQPGASAQIDGDNYKAIFDGIGYEKISEAQRQEAFEKALSYLEIKDPSKNILLVQDDESDLAELFKDEPELRGLFKNYLPIYQKLLANHPSLKTITINSDSSLSNYLNSNDLASYDAVIWFTGSGLGFFSEEGTTLTTTDADMLKNYLSNGGKLLLTGQNALSGQEKSPLVKDYLHLTVFPDMGPSLNVEGLSGGIYENTKYDVNRFETPYYFADLVKSNVPNDPRTIINSKYVSDYSQAYDYYSGTSMAAPHTTGTAAILLGLRPSMSPEMLKLYTSTKGKNLETLKGLVSSSKLVKSSNLDNFDDSVTPGVPLENSVLNDNLNVTTDKNDVFALSLKEGEALSLSLNGLAGTDFDLYVYNESTTSIENTNGMLAYSENVNTSNETIKFTAPKTGIYFVNVYAYKGAGSYKLFTGNFGGSYEDDSNSMTFLGEWMPIFDPQHSGESAKALNSIGEVNFSFVGDSFEWQGFKDPTQGIADIFIDGIKIGSPSLYASTFKAKQTIFRKDFSSYGRHNVKIVWTGKSDPASRKSASGINLDKLIVRSNPVSLKASYDMGKKYPVITWTTVQWAESYSIYRKESSQSDYVQIKTMPISSASYTDTTAVPGKSYNYTVVINTKDKTETPFSTPFTFVYDDDIKGSLPISGTVKGSLNTELKDVNDVWSKRLDQGKTYEITLTGPAVANFDLSLFNIGSTTIYDPKKPAIKKSTGTASSEKIIFKPGKSGLYYIVPTALKGSGQYSISISVQTARMVENTDSTIKYSGVWTKPKYTSASGGTVNQTKGISGSLEYAFSGTGITLYAVKDKVMGKADIYIDGVKVKQIDLYSSSRKYKVNVFETQTLANKAHKIKIVATGKKTSAATSAHINIDAFKVTLFTLLK